jgi:hypothetical protein
MLFVIFLQVNANIVLASRSWPHSLFFLIIVVIITIVIVVALLPLMGRLIDENPTHIHRLATVFFSV